MLTIANRNTNLAGDRDGAAFNATFNYPTGLVYQPNDRSIVVSDSFQGVVSGLKQY